MYTTDRDTRSLVSPESETRFLGQRGVPPYGRHLVPKIETLEPCFLGGRQDRDLCVDQDELLGGIDVVEVKPVGPETVWLGDRRAHDVGATPWSP